MQRLTARIRRYARRGGAHLFGVAPVERFAGAPRGHHPADLLPDCKSVIVLGTRLLDRGLEHWQMLPEGAEFLPDENVRYVMQEYFWEVESHGPPSDLLSDLAFRVALNLQDAGYGTIYMRSSNDDKYGQQHLLGKIRPNTSLFSHRHAAVRAGLGEFGLNNLVITPEYGPRVRFASVLTAAPLEPSPLLAEKTCLGVKCSLCLKHCGPEGVLTPAPAAHNDQVWIDMVGRTDKEMCLTCSQRTSCKGQCQRACPVGYRV